MNPHTWAVSMTISPGILRYTFPLTRPPSEHAWIRASGKGLALQLCVIQICASAEMLTGRQIKYQMQNVICLVTTTHLKYAVDLWLFHSIGRVRRKQKYAYGKLFPKIKKILPNNIQNRTSKACWNKFCLIRGNSLSRQRNLREAFVIVVIWVPVSMIWRCMCAKPLRIPCM